MQSVFLVGFMGSGKSFWGGRLADALEVPFYDLDALIVERSGKSISDIFAALGEQGFRELERDYLLELLDQPPAVISTGGGTPCFFDNMQQMNRRGKTIYLEIPLEVLVQRLEKGKHKRPLIAGLSAGELSGFIENMLEKRLPFYQLAQEKPQWSGEEEEYLKRLIASAT